MNYLQTLEYLYSQLPMFQRVGAAAYKADLGNTLALVELLGHPEKKFQSVHVAGTNGKGSVSHMLASVLQEAGYKTGLYTSPHLKDFRERIRINGQMIPKQHVTRFLNRYRIDFENIKPSFFEYTAVMAFDHFAREQVDIAIIETGMGGRLDSTNVITPILSVITNISLDHTAFLGKTLPEIAREKAGIIKPGIPVVIGETQQECAGIFMDRAGELNCRILFADQKYEAIKSATATTGPTGMEWNINRDGTVLLEGLICPLGGNYQQKNIVTSFGTIDRLKEQGMMISNDNIRCGLEKVVKNTAILGRWQQLGDRPRVICDVGHNEAGINHILVQLSEESYRYLHWVFGMVNDKDPDTILGMLPRLAHYYFCKPDIPRGMDAGELKKRAGKFKLEGKAYPSVREAYREAMKNATPEDLVFVGGSTFVVAEIV
jgi:dihydrofolate synthase/folylpolyglutamate synthase